MTISTRYHFLPPSSSPLNNILFIEIIRLQCCLRGEKKNYNNVCMRPDASALNPRKWKLLFLHRKLIKWGNSFTLLWIKNHFLCSRAGKHCMSNRAYHLLPWHTGKSKVTVSHRMMWLLQFHKGSAYGKWWKRVKMASARLQDCCGWKMMMEEKMFD